MKVFALHYHAEFDLEEYENIYCYDSFDKAHTNFIDIIREWEDDEDNRYFEIMCDGYFHLFDVGEEVTLPTIMFHVENSIEEL